MKTQSADDRIFDVVKAPSRQAPTWFAAIVGGVLLVSCTFDDDERCAKGYAYDAPSHACVVVEETDDTTNSDAETGTSTQAGSDSSADTDETDETGIGTPCTPDGNECDGLEASYCAMNPVSGTGYCTLEGCTSDPSTCPPSYTCCDMPFPKIPNFCATDEDAELMGSQCGKP